MKRPNTTPGPWRLALSTYRATITQSGLPVADIQACHHEPWKANAQAIAAVPDLLEALECLALDLRNAAKGHGIGNLDTMAGLAESALAKAGYTL